jgi:hypothetical protein
MEGEMEFELRFVQARRGLACDLLRRMVYEEQTYQDECAKRVGLLEQCDEWY